MMAPTHALIGGTSAFVVSTAAVQALGEPTYVDLGVVALAVFFATASSSLPDNLEKPPRWVTKHAPKLAKRLPHLPHRTVTHWPALQLAVVTGLTIGVSAASGLPILLVAVGLTGPVALGCVMHSIADAMTVDRRGVPLLWPVSRRGYHLVPRWARPRVGTGSRSEWCFSAVWCLLVITYTYARFRNSIPS